ncbi:MAG: SDR family oxidoreductase [Spirochaetales bacterium]|nr:SDR family oxidoreductase [Spirochaetales bacterium]
MKTVVITGASSGIGYGTAKAFASCGKYRVFGSVRKQEDGERLKKDFGPNFEPLRFDITDHGQVAEAAEFVGKHIPEDETCGLINNAGIAVTGPLMHLSGCEMRKQFEVNVIGQMIVTQAFLPLLKIRKSKVPPGRILFISSSSGKIPYPYLGAYVGSKHAIEGMARTLRIELLLYGIDVIVIGPGAVNTPLWKNRDSLDIERFHGTDYYGSLTSFKAGFTRHGENGTDIYTAGMKIRRIFEKRRPRARYALVKHSFGRWLLPRLMPDRLFARCTAQKMGFL